MRANHVQRTKHSENLLSMSYGLTYHVAPHTQELTPVIKHNLLLIFALIYYTLIYEMQYIVGTHAQPMKVWVPCDDSTTITLLLLKYYLSRYSDKGHAFHVCPTISSDGCR